MKKSILLKYNPILSKSNVVWDPRYDLTIQTQLYLSTKDHSDEGIILIVMTWIKEESFLLGITSNSRYTIRYKYKGEWKTI